MGLARIVVLLVFLQPLTVTFALTCSQVVARIRYSQDWTADRAAIEKLFHEEFPETFSYADVRLLMAYFDVRETPIFQRLSNEERQATALNVIREMAKLPSTVREVNERAGFHLALTVDNVVEHPRMAAYANRRPRGHARGSTWKNVAGAGSSAEVPGAIVAVRKLKTGHGSANIVLHEVGHNFDHAWGRFHLPPPQGWWARRRDRRHGRCLSQTNHWLAIHRKYVWPTDYEQRYPEEALVESIARYFYGPTLRAHLRVHQPEAYAFVEREVAGYTGPPPLDAPPPLAALPSEPRP